MNYFLALLYCLVSGVVIMIPVFLSPLIFSLLRPLRNDVKTNIYFVSLIYFVGAAIFVFWSAFIYELMQQFNYSSYYFLKKLILFLLFFYLITIFSRENVRLANRVKQGEYGYEYIAISLNGAGIGKLSIFVFYFFPSLNNHLFGELPKSLISWLAN